MLIEALSLIGWFIVAFISAFVVTPYFYDVMPKNVFIATFFFIGIFVSWFTTYIANLILDQEKDVGEAVKEGFTRSTIGFGIMTALAFVIVQLLLLG